MKIPGLKILANKDMVLYGVRMSRGAAEVEEVAAESEEGAEGAEAAEGDKPEAEEKK